MKAKKNRIVIVSAVLILLIALGVFCSIFHSFDYDRTVFGKAYGINFNIYASFAGSYASMSPSYYLSANGCLYQTSRASGTETAEKLTDAMRPFELTEQNFDDPLKGNYWTAYDMDAQYVREHTQKAWYGFADEGQLYYILLQENGDVFLCMGSGSGSLWKGLDVKGLGIIYFLNDLGEWEP